MEERRAGGRSIGDVLVEAAALDPDRPALVLAGEATTYGELSDAVDRCAAGLVACGVSPGWRVPLVDDASVLSVAALVALARTGAAAALMNPRLTAGELQALREAAGAAPVGVAGAAYAG
ncbi:MAG: AMP-binding protein, partial [Acidimicrobiales bacterium]